jgi:hypothetical protein
MPGVLVVSNQFSLTYTIIDLAVCRLTKYILDGPSIVWHIVFKVWGNMPSGI